MSTKTAGHLPANVRWRRGMLVVAAAAGFSVWGFAQQSREATMAPTTTPAGQLLTNGGFEPDMAGWSYVAEGDASGSAKLVSEKPLGEKTPHSLRLEAPQLGKRCGIANSGGASGISVEQGRWYDVTFFARNEEQRGIGLVFSLETPDGAKVCARTTLPEIGRGGIGTSVEGSDWREYTVSLHAYASDPHCRLVISPIEPGTLFFDEVSLVQRKLVGESLQEAKP